AAQLARFDFEIAYEDRPGQSERNLVADLIIFRAANDLAHSAAAIIDLANAQPIGIRMLRGFLNLCDDDLLEIRTALFDSFDLDAAHGEQLRQLIDARRRLHEFAQPVNGKFHVWGAHAPPRAPFGASPNGRENMRDFSARAPKTAREARALPRRRISALMRIASGTAGRSRRNNEDRESRKE